MNRPARSYLDHNASSPVRPEVAAMVARALMLAGNPSSIHAEGRAARAAIELAREQVAKLVGAKAGQVTFTSGGTEAANTVLSGAFARIGQTPPQRLLMSATEHPCISAGHRFPPDKVDVVPVDGFGNVDLAALRRLLAVHSDESVLISVHAANNETGVLQPLAEIVAIARTHRAALVHSDAVQAAGKIPLDFEELGLDALTVSGHKFAGPKGIGAFVMADGCGLDTAFLRGGGQEATRRGGTENVAGIAGMGEAARLALQNLEAEATRLRALRDWLESRLISIAPDTVTFGRGTARLPNTASFAVPDLEAAAALIAMDLAGIAISSGSACSSGKVARSPVLGAMGISPALTAGALRVSLGWNTSREDVTRFLAAFERVLASLYERKGQAA